LLGPAGAAAGHVLGVLPLGVKGVRSLRHLALSPADACARKHAYGQFESGARTGLYSADFAHSVRDADPFAGFRRAYAACASRDPLDRALYVDVKTYLVDDILMKVDKMSMAVSLEVRAPFLDPRVAEYAASLPRNYKLRGRKSKYILKRAVADQKGYYLIGYRPDESTFDRVSGRRKFHHLTLKINRPGKFNVRMREDFHSLDLNKFLFEKGIVASHIVTQKKSLEKQFLEILQEAPEEKH